jgi:hypothetical protein
MKPKHHHAAHTLIAAIFVSVGMFAVAKKFERPVTPDVRYILPGSPVTLQPATSSTNNPVRLSF